ncbi:MAG: hypothetical protein LBQ71_12510 [Hungatella sp.]|jgi:hypothetical protein|nr:hypothetical protein [Hungatella sp.]
MAALIDVRDTSEIANGGRTLVIPVKGNTIIYQGSLVAIDTNGYAIPGAKAANLTAAGRAEETADNTGGEDGAITIRVSRGIFVWDNTTTTANKITSAHLLKPCYMEDDQTVTALATGASVAGIVVRVDEDGVAVEINPALTASITGA